MINEFQTLFEARERKFQQEKLFRGESVDLVARITTDGVPDSLDGYAVEGYYQPTDYVGTDNESVFYAVNAEIIDEKVIVHWTYDKDFGKAAYNIWALLTKSGEQSYPVCWRLALAHSPSYPPGETPEPMPQTLDFSKYELLNAPWLELSSAEAMSAAIEEDIGEVQNALSDYLPLSGGSVNMGFNLKVAGYNVLSGLNGPIAIGTGSSSKRFSVAVGSVAVADHLNSIAIGAYTKSTGDNATAIGAYAQALSAKSTAIGNTAYATKENATAVGFGARARAQNAIGLGFGATVDAENSIQFGYGTNNVPNSLKVFDKMVLSGDNLTLNPERVPYLSSYAKKEDIPEVPTDLSAFTNSPGYLTAHQSLSDYYTKEEADGTFLTAHQSLSDFLPLSGGTVDWLSVDSANFNVKNLLSASTREDGKMGSLFIGSDIRDYANGNGRLAPIIIGNDIATYGQTNNDFSYPNIAIGNDNVVNQDGIVIGGACGRKYEYDLETGPTLIFNPNRQSFDLNDLVFVDENGDPVTPAMIANDQITMPDVSGVDTIYVYRNNEWGRYVTRKIAGRIRQVWEPGGEMKQNVYAWYYHAGSEGGNIKLKFEPDPINSVDHSAAAGFSIAIGNDTMAGGWISADVYHEWFNAGAIAIGHGTIAKDVGTLGLGTNSLIEGDGSIGIGFNANTSAESAIQLGTGTNSTPHSLQYEDTQIVAKTYDTSLSAWTNPKLNPDLLPNALSAVMLESWTFTLDDDSTVTKNVLIG